MDFCELKLSEKIGDVFSIAMRDRKYNRYQFLNKWCNSETCEAVFDFDETLVSQARSYILRVFEKEFEDNLPELDEDSSIYEDDLYWIGYLITYWHFYEGISGKEIWGKYDICRSLDSFDVLHSMSIKTAIEKIKEDDCYE